MGSHQSLQYIPRKKVNMREAGLVPPFPQSTHVYARCRESEEALTVKSAILPPLSRKNPRKAFRGFDEIVEGMEGEGKGFF